LTSRTTLGTWPDEVTIPGPPADRGGTPRGVGLLHLWSPTLHTHSEWQFHGLTLRDV